MRESPVQSKRIILCFLLVLTLILFAGNSFAEIRYGRMSLSPYLLLTEMYRSNIYQTERDTKSDFVTVTDLGVRFSSQFGANNTFDAGYKVGFLNYARYSRNDYTDQRGDATLNVRFPGGLGFRLSHNYIDSTFERSAAIGRMRDYNQNLTTFSASYAFADRWKIEPKYGRDHFLFEKSIDRMGNYLSQTLGASLYFRFLPRVSALGEYEYLNKEFSILGRDSDHIAHTVYFGLSFDPVGKLKGVAKFGYSSKKFDRRIPGRDDNPRSWVTSIDLTQDFTRFTRLSLVASRGFMDDPDWQNASLTISTISASLHHMFTRKIGGTLNGSFRENRYLDRRTDPITGVTKKRLDKTYSVGCGAFYNIQEWLQAALDYSYTDKDSNFEGYSFSENRVMFRIMLRMP